MAGRLKRYHGWPVLHTQTVGEHCARVANIYVSLFGMPRADVLFYALNHDAGELLAGDVPFGGKDKVQGLREAVERAEKMGLTMLGIALPELTELERRKLKIADLLEMHEFGRIEELMGNKLASPITQATLEAALKCAEKIGMYYIIQEWLEQPGNAL
jgi:5'-deoxynucleotidase YfbR-like HD superfamily hydrolase